MSRITFQNPNPTLLNDQYAIYSNRFSKSYKTSYISFSFCFALILWTLSPSSNWFTVFYCVTSLKKARNRHAETAASSYSFMHQKKMKQIPKSVHNFHVMSVWSILTIYITWNFGRRKWNFSTYHIMENKAGRKSKRMEWLSLTKYCRMIKKILRSEKATAVSVLVSPHLAVCCEELFLSSKRKKKQHHKRDYCVDPFLAAHIAAQNHFTLRPNIYLWQQTNIKTTLYQCSKRC